MATAVSTIVITRRAVLQAFSCGGLGLAYSALTARPSLGASTDSLSEENELIKRLIGGIAAESPLVHLQMPPVFGNGYSVPLTLAVDSPMTEADHVRSLHVLAPKNPIVVVADFDFTPSSGRAAISTRIRLAQSQNVLAVAETSDGTLLMARSWVKVDSNGCA